MYTEQGRIFKYAGKVTSHKVKLFCNALVLSPDLEMADHGS